MKHSSKIIIISIVSLMLFLLISNSYYTFYFQEIIVAGFRFKPEGTQEPGTSPYLDSRLYLFNPLTQSFIPISPDNIDAYVPVWSPNGELLAYLYVQDNTKEGIGIIDKYYQTKYFELPPDASPTNSNLTWLPNSETILFSSRLQDCHILHELNIKNGAISEVENLPKICEGNNPNFTVSSRGEIVVELSGKIFALDIGGQNLRFITEGYSPIWHPNQNLLIYECDKGICETTPDGKNQHILFLASYQAPISPWDISWAFGEKYIGFVNGSGAEGDHRYLTVIDMRIKKAHNIYKITGRGRDAIMISNAAWRP